MVQSEVLPIDFLRTVWPFLAFLLRLGFLSCMSLTAEAQPTTPAGQTEAPVGLPPSLPQEQPGEDLLTRPTLTGDWGGLRTTLLDAGFDLRAAYVGEYAYSFSGGQRIGGDLAQQFAFGADIDMGKVAGIAGGILHITFNAREGRSTSADYIGNLLSVQEVYGGGEDFRMAELFYEQKLADNFVNLKAGYYAMGSDFATTPILCDFMNVGFCSHPQSLPNNAGWSDYPNARWGGRVRFNLPSNIYAEIGVYDVDPTDALHGNGLKVNLSGSTGAIIPIEFGKTVALGPSALTGNYKLGAYYDTSEVNDIAYANTSRTGRYGGYLLMDQMVWRFQPGTDRGLIVVADTSISDSRTARVPSGFLLAIVAQGPMASRPNDFIGIGFIHALVNSRAVNAQSAQLMAQDIENRILVHWRKCRRGWIWAPGHTVVGASPEPTVHWQSGRVFLSAHPERLGFRPSDESCILTLSQQADCPGRVTARGGH